MANVNINGKSAKLYKINDIKELLSSKVKEYLEKGYVLNISTMTGMQSSEIMHVDVTNDGGKSITRFWISRTYSALTGKDRYTITTELFKTNGDGGYHTLWNGQGETLSTETFYYLGKGSTYELADNYPFVKDEEVIDECYKLHEKRWNRRRRGTEKHIEPNSRILRVVNKQKGCKTVKLSDIAYMQRATRDDKFDGYNVYFKGAKSTITIPLKKDW